MCVRLFTHTPLTLCIWGAKPINSKMFGQPNGLLDGPPPPLSLSLSLCPYHHPMLTVWHFRLFFMYIFQSSQPQPDDRLELHLKKDVAFLVNIPHIRTFVCKFCYMFRWACLKRSQLSGVLHHRMIRSVKLPVHTAAREPLEWRNRHLDLCPVIEKTPFNPEKFVQFTPRETRAHSHAHCRENCDSTQS